MEKPKSAFWDLLEAYRRYDPATESCWEILFLYPGIKAWIFHKMAHFLFKKEIPFLPRLLSEVGRFLSAIDIHPGATIGARVIMDHGAGIVIGETAVIEDDVLIYQGVTLGGTSLERAKRHPTIEKHCVIGAGAKILGNIVIGEGSRVGANSVVVRDVPPGCTVVGIPGKVIASGGVIFGHELDHDKLPDPFLQKFAELESRIQELERKS